MVNCIFSVIYSWVLPSETSFYVYVYIQVSAFKPDIRVPIGVSGDLMDVDSRSWRAFQLTYR